MQTSDITATNNRFVSTGSTPTAYDPAGNITADSKFRAMNYSYDANSRQTFAEHLDHTSQQTSVYDAVGQRVQTIAAGVTRQMVYDAFGQSIAEYSGGSLQRDNIYRGGQLLATNEPSGGGLKYVLQDVQGSTRVMMSGGNIAARHDYLPFGEEISSGTGLRTTTQGYGATDTNRQKYALTERDDATGLDHTWWRKYENSSGRWTTPDPYNGSMSIGSPQSFNRYAYVGNDPVNFVDSSGLDLKCKQGDDGKLICTESTIVTVYAGYDDDYLPGSGGHGVGRTMRRPLSQQKSGCEKFVDQLMNSVDQAGASVTQRAIGVKLALSATHGLKNDAAANKLDYSGFKESLIAGGQNGWAMVHIQGIAGSYLAGYTSPIEDQFREDKNQLEVGLDWKAMGRTTIPYARRSDYPLDKYIAEKQAEIEDDHAGVDVGDALSDKINGRVVYDVAKVKIWNRLCDK